MLFGYLQEWFWPGESDLLPFGIALIVIGFLLGEKVSKGQQGTMAVSCVLVYLVLGLLRNMLYSFLIDFVLLFFTGIAVSLLGGMLLRDAVAYFRTR